MRFRNLCVLQSAVAVLQDARDLAYPQDIADSQNLKVILDLEILEVLQDVEGLEGLNYLQDPHDLKIVKTKVWRIWRIYSMGNAF